LAVVALVSLSSLSHSGEGRRRLIFFVTGAVIISADIEEASTRHTGGL
jgi:hypothetical protein